MKRLLAVLCVIAMLFMIPCNTENVLAVTKPEIVVSSYTLPEDILFGEDTTITVTLSNMSKEFKATGILLTYSSSNNSVIPAKGTSNQIYVEQIGSGQNYNVELPVAILEAQEGYGNMNFTISYNVEGQNLQNTSSYIAFPLNMNSLTVNTINVVTNTTVGASSLVSVGFENTRADEAQNVNLVITGDVKGGEQTKAIGNVYAGQNKFVETGVIFDSVGEKNIKVAMTFDDVNGNNHTVSVGEYQVSVTDGSGSTGASQEGVGEVGNTANLNLSIIFLGLAAVLVIILVILVIVGSKKKRR